MPAMSRTRSRAPEAAATGRDSASRTGAAASAMRVRNGSNTAWSALPIKTSAAASRISSVGAVRCKAARNGASARISEAPQPSRLCRTPEGAPQGPKTRGPKVQGRARGVSAAAEPSFPQYPRAISRLKLTTALHADQKVFQRLHLFQGASGAERDAAQRVLGDRYRQSGRMTQHEIQIGEQRAAASQHDTLIDDIGGQFGRGVFERDLDRLDDLSDRLGEAFADLPFGDDNLLRDAVHQVAALDLH